MTIKEATSRMLRDILSQRNLKKRTPDKEIAKELGITPASFSRLITEVTTPKIATWYKIIKLHENEVGFERNCEIITSIEE